MYAPVLNDGVGIPVTHEVGVGHAFGSSRGEQRKPSRKCHATGKGRLGHHQRGRKRNSPTLKCAEREKQHDTVMRRQGESEGLYERERERRMETTCARARVREGGRRGREGPETSKERGIQGQGSRWSSRKLACAYAYPSALPAAVSARLRLRMQAPARSPQGQCALQEFRFRFLAVPVPLHTRRSLACRPRPP